MEAHRLSEVNQYIRQVIALNFNEPIWVNAEISQVKSSRGHYYLDLVEKDTASDEVIALAQAAIWFNAAQFIRKKLGDLTDQLLVAGTEIQCKVRIDFHEKYGLKFIIEDIDPSYTFGQLELERQKTIERLEKEQLLGANRNTTLPPVLRKIAVISSAQAAGWIDFQNELLNNPYNYRFTTQLFQASMQGKQLEQDVLTQLKTILKRKDSFDCVVIIRGGGSKLDLSGFDSYAIAQAVALFPIPVITGIGHEIDTNVIELVAHSPLKTPTAAAQFITEHNARFESEVLELFREIEYKSRQRLQQTDGLIRQLNAEINYKARNSLLTTKALFAQMDDRLKYRFRHIVSEHTRDLDELVQRIELSNPFRIMGKGYTLSYSDGKLLRSIFDVKAGVEISTSLIDGTILSTTTRIIESDPDKRKK